MFSGIVQGKATVLSITRKTNFMQLRVELPVDSMRSIQQGASIALNGTCLTVTEFSGNQVQFDLIAQTLNLTNLNLLEVGSKVNFERATQIGDEIGGHLLSGHVHTQVTVTAIEKSENNRIIWFELPPLWQPYIFNKGFIALNGCSLTIAEVKDNIFCVYLIPETLRQTTFGNMQTGTMVNMEIDSQTQAIVDTVERYLQQNRQ